MTQKNFVELRNVTKRFGSNTVIDNINLTIPQGQMVTLLGPSGCGKTTILRLVAGLEKPSEGQIFIDGEDVTHRSIQQRDICMVFQSYALFPHMSLGENVGYGLKMLGVSRAEVKTRVKEALAMVDLEGFEDRFVDQISGGQQQRVALARALILKPKVLHGGVARTGDFIAGQRYASAAGRRRAVLSRNPSVRHVCAGGCGIKCYPCFRFIPYRHLAKNARWRLTSYRAWA